MSEKLEIQRERILAYDEVLGKLESLGFEQTEGGVFTLDDKTIDLSKEGNFLKENAAGQLIFVTRIKLPNGDIETTEWEIGEDNSIEEKNDSEVDPELIFQKINKLRILNGAKPFPKDEMHEYTKNNTQQYLNLLNKLIIKAEGKKGGVEKTSKINGVGVPETNKTNSEYENMNYFNIPNFLRDLNERAGYKRKDSVSDNLETTPQTQNERFGDDCCEEVRAKLTDMETNINKNFAFLKAASMQNLSNSGNTNPPENSDTDPQEPTESNQPQNQVETSPEKKSLWGSVARWYTNLGPWKKKGLTYGLIGGTSLLLGPAMGFTLSSVSGTTIFARLVGGTVGGLLANKLSSTYFNYKTRNNEKFEGLSLDEAIEEQRKKEEEVIKLKKERGEVLSEFRYGGEEKMSDEQKTEYANLTNRLNKMEANLREDAKTLAKYDLIRRALTTLGAGIGARVGPGVAESFFGSEPSIPSTPSGAGTDQEYINAVNAEADNTYGNTGGGATETAGGISDIGHEYAPIEYKVAHGDGAIASFDKLQDSLMGYTDPKPPIVEHILKTDPTELAKEYGFYRPGETNESAMLLKGDSFSINETGDLVYNRADGASTILQVNGFPDQTNTYDGRMFSYQGDAPQATGVAGGYEVLTGADGAPLATGSATGVEVGGEYDTDAGTSAVPDTTESGVATAPTSEDIDVLVDQKMNDSLSQLFPEKGFWIFKTPGGIDSPAWQELSKMTMGEFNAISSPISSLDNVNGTWEHTASWEDVRGLKAYFSSSIANYANEATKYSSSTVSEFMKGVVDSLIKASK